MSEFNNLSVCCLAYGKEHIDEYNLLAKSIPTELFVATDSPNQIEKGNIIVVNEPFNYNLKYKSIEEAFKKTDVVLFLDTDIYVNRNIDFSLISNLEDGFYTTTAPYSTFTHMGETINIFNILNTEYGKEINNLSTKLSFVDEQKFIIKLSDKNDRLKFISVWDSIYNTTKHTHIKNKTNQLPGIYEGLIISTICEITNTKIIYDNINIQSFFSAFNHYGWDIETPKPSLI